MMINLEEQRKELLERLFYLQLITSLTPVNKGGVMDKPVRKAIIEMGRIIQHSSDVDFLLKKDNIHHFLVSTIKKYKDLFYPKKSIRVIGREFNELLQVNDDLYKYGIFYGWLNERIEFKDKYPNDLPHHTKIGIGAHAASINIEEEFLLRDSFFLLIMAEITYKKLRTSVEEFKAENRDITTLEERALFSNYSQTIATYSRMGILNFYSFVEAFINSIGYDFAMKSEISLSESEREMLNGRKGNGFLSLEKKIEKFQEIIRQDKLSIIKTTDSKQLKEPFLTFLTEIKSTRDSSVHYSPLKESIWHSPDDWIDKINNTSILCINLSKEIWKACYPNRDLPEYLFRLDYEKHIDLAKERVNSVVVNTLVG